MAAHHSQDASFSVSFAASSYLLMATRQSLAAYALLPSLNAFMARTWFMYPQPASVTLSPTNSANNAAEDRIFIKILLFRTRSRAIRLCHKTAPARQQAAEYIYVPEHPASVRTLYFRPSSLDTIRGNSGVKPIKNW